MSKGSKAEARRKTREQKANRDARTALSEERRAAREIRENFFAGERDMSVDDRSLKTVNRQER